MRSSVSAHAQARAQLREVAGAAFYTHVTGLARQVGDSSVENHPQEVADENRPKDGVVDWGRSLIPITPPPTKYRRSTEYFHPKDPRRQRQLERERDEFAIKWTTENNNGNRGQDGGDETPDDLKCDEYEGIDEDEESETFYENGPDEEEGKGERRRTVVLITIGENEEESEVMSRTGWTGRKRFREEDDNGRRRNRDDQTGSSSGSIIERRSSSSKTMKQNRIVWRDHGSPEALSTLSTAVDEGDTARAKRSKITKDDTRFCDIPELLDERVGNANPFIVRIPRTAITLNLNSYNSHNGGSAKKDTAQSRPATEIRLADSSVPDLAPNGNEENIVPVEKCTVTKKPKIIEDLTCLEGTILSPTSLKKFTGEPTEATRKRRTLEAEEKSARNGGDDDAPRKSRIHEKFRRLFGSDLTLSESDEEKRITAKLTSRKRRNESRMSSDSGVCLNEHTFDMISSEALEKPRENENPGEYPREKLRKNSGENPEQYTGENPRANPKEYSTKKPRENSVGKSGECTSEGPRENSIGKPREFPSERPRKNSIRKSREFPSEDPGETSPMKKEDAEVESAAVRSMPLLDSVCDQRAEEAGGETLPDSSTSLLEKISTQPDSSSGGKLTILVTPLNIQDSDAFDPLRLEFNLSEDAQISIPTSTTSGPPIVEPIKLERSFQDPQNLVRTYADDSCPIGNRVSIEEDLSPEAETESYDDDRLIISEDLDNGTDQTPREREASEESGQSILEIPIEPQWPPDSMNGLEQKLSNGTDVNSSSALNATADKTFVEMKYLAGSNLPIEEIPRPETALEVREKIPKDFSSGIDDSSSAHQKLLIISARIVDFDPASGMVVDPGETIKVSNEISPGTVDLNSAVGPNRQELENFVSVTRPSNGDETIVSNNSSAKLSEVTIDDSLTGESGQKSANLAFEFELNDLTPQGLEDRTKVPRSLDHEVPDSEIPKCVLDVQKPKDIPKAPNLRVLHPSELGSRWCPTPFATEAPQNLPRFSPSTVIAQPPLHPPFPQYPHSQILRNQSCPPIRQPPPEALMQTPPPSPLEHMQFLVSQTSSSAVRVEDLSCKKSSGYLHVSQGPAHTGSGVSPSWSADKHQNFYQNWLMPTSSPNAATPLDKHHSLMGRIFNCLILMAAFIERIKRENDTSTIYQIVNDYVAQRECLFVELRRYACTQGTNDLLTIVTRIMNYYEYRVPPERRTLNVEGVLYMIKLEHATMASALYTTRPTEPRPPPRYRPIRPSVTQSSLFTESQRQLLDQQISAYNHQMQVLRYQLVAQTRAKEEVARLSLEAAKAKKTRRRKPRVPAGQNQTVQVSAAGGRERPNLSTGRELRRLAPAPVNHQSTLQQTIDCTVERNIGKKGVGNSTVTDKRHEEIVDLAFHDRSIDSTVADIVNELFRQHPAERMAEGQAVERNSQCQIIETKLQGHNMVDNIQGQTVDVNVQGQKTHINVQRQSIEKDVRFSAIERSAQGQTTGVNFEGQSFDSNVQGKSVAENLQFQSIERNARDKTIERSAPCQITEKNLPGQIIERSIHCQASYTNVRGQTVERNVQGQIIEIDVKGQDIERSVEGQAIEKMVQGQAIEKMVQGQAIDINVRDQYTEKSVQGQTIEVTAQGQIIERSVQGQAVDINVRDQYIEKSVQGQTSEKDIEAQTNKANISGQAIKESVQFGPIEVNARAEAIEDNVQGLTIGEEDSPVESALNRSSSSVEDGNTSVLDVLKEFEVLESITKGPVSRASKPSKTMKSSEDNKLTDSITKERGSKAADPTCPEDSPSPPTISAKTVASVDGVKTDTHEGSDPATSVDVEAGSSRMVPVITIDDDEDWDLASTNSVETVRDAEHATIADEFSILDVKSISKDVFNNMGEKMDETITTPVARTDEERMDDVETEDECIDIKTELSDCFQCGKRSEVVCEQCRLAAYCSPKCHQEHWSAIHHLTCKPAPQEIIETTA